MIALDTNVLARYLLNDSPAQARRAEQLLSGPQTCTAPLTVLLELVWVLESCDCAREDIVQALSQLCGLEHFAPPQPEALLGALQWYAAGFDFADALHLAQSADASTFQTFDRAFAKAAAKADTQPAVALLR